MDDACIVSRALGGLAKAVEVIGDVCQAFALNVSEKTRACACLHHVHRGRWCESKRSEMPTEIASRTRICWMRIRRYIRELYGQSKVALSLKTRVVKAEAIKAHMYGCSTWTLRQEHYSKVHHRVGIASYYRGTAQTRPSDDFLQSCSRDKWM